MMQNKEDINKTHDAVNNFTILDCYGDGGARSNQASGGHHGEGGMPTGHLARDT